MKKTLLLILPCFIIFSASAQAAQAPHDQPYGKVDLADLQATSCDFEKDANAEVLLATGKFYYSEDLNAIVGEYHKRIKIFNTNGNGEADIRIAYESFNKDENISGVEAETINLVDGKAEVTKLDKKLIFSIAIDNEYSQLSFSMPNIKPGCVIDIKYKWNATYNNFLPTWIFQDKVPVRYSELTLTIPDIFYFRQQPHFNQALATHTTTSTAGVYQKTTHTLTITNNGASSDQQSDSYPYINNTEVWGMANIPSLRIDPYTSSFEDNTQKIGFDLVSMKSFIGIHTNFSDTWAKVGYNLYKSAAFGDQLTKSLTGEQDIISKAATLKSADDKIAFVFDTVKRLMKWNGADRWYTHDGTSKAWDNKSGNSTEINIIVYHLLNKLNIEAYPMVVSTRDNGRADPYSTSLYQFNRTVVYVPVDASKNYILDATGKYNQYNETPAELLNSFGLYIDKNKKIFDTVTIKKDLPVRQVILINAEIKPGGKMAGTAQINSVSYDRINAIKRYKTDGEKKYSDYLADFDNNLKISSLKLENMEVDTLPLTQNIGFDLDLAGSDENYIYLKPNLFASLKTNPFLSEIRLNDIYFGYLRSYSINGVYKLPAGYKTDALPKSVTLVMPDKSISFKRIVAEQEGSVLVHFVVDIRKPAFNAGEYPGVHDFYKKMYELLNEQVVLKKI